MDADQKIDDDNDGSSSVASDYSILPDSAEVENISMAQPYLAVLSRHGAEEKAKQNFNQVEFLNVCASYPVSQDLLLYYKFNVDFKPAVTDRLALYKVGFTSLQHHLHYEWAPRNPVAAPPVAAVSEEGEPEIVYSVTFPKKRLPRDDSEFYQVCYLNEQQQIKGVSSTFQLVSEGSSSFSGSDIVSAVEQHDGSVLVSSDLHALHANNDLMKQNVSMLEKDNSSLTALVKAQEKDLAEKNKEIEELQERLKRAAQVFEMQKRAVDQDRKISQARIEELASERNQIQNMIEVARDAQDRMSTELSKQSDEVAALNDQLKKIKLSEASLKQSEADLIDKLECTTNQLEALQEKQTLLLEEKQTNELKALKEREELKKELDHALEQLQEADREKLPMSEQLDSLEAQTRALRVRLNEQEVELTEKSKELEDGHAALQELTEKLTLEQEELNISEERRKVLDLDNEELKQCIDQLQQEIKQLTTMLIEARNEKDAIEKVATALSKKQRDVAEQYQFLAMQRKKYMSIAQNLIDGSATLKDLKDVMDAEGPSSSLKGYDEWANVAMETFLTEAAGSIKESHHAAVDANNSVEEKPATDCGNDTPAQGTVSVNVEEAPVAIVVDSCRNEGAKTSSVEIVSSATSSLAALELSSKVDLKMNSMIEEVLSHVKQLKQMIEKRDADNEDTESKKMMRNYVEDCVERLQEASNAESSATMGDNATRQEEEEVYMDAPARLNTDAATNAAASVQSEDSAPKAEVCPQEHSEEEVLEAFQEEPLTLTNESDVKTAAVPLSNSHHHFSPVISSGRTASVFLPPQYANATTSSSDARGQQTAGASAPQTAASGSYNSLNAGINVPFPDPSNPGLPPPLLPEITETAKNVAQAAAFSSIGAIMTSLSHSWCQAGLQPMAGARPSAPHEEAGLQPMAGARPSAPQEESVSSEDSLSSASFASYGPCYNMSQLTTSRDRSHNRYGRHNRFGSGSNSCGRGLSIIRGMRQQRQRAKEWQARMRAEASSANCTYSEEPVEGDVMLVTEMANASDEVNPQVEVAQEREEEAVVQQEVNESEAAAANATNTQENTEEDPFLHCPMCPLKFGRKSYALMEEHIESHLEYVCPICSLTFQRNNKEEFEAHVGLHLDDEDRLNNPEGIEDPSGPWNGVLAQAARRFHEFD